MERVGSPRVHHPRRSRSLVHAQTLRSRSSDYLHDNTGIRWGDSSSSATAPHEMRQATQVFQELLQTEAQYVSDLRILVNEFRNPIHEENILPSKDLNSIFSNLHIILPCNEEFLIRLKNIEDVTLQTLASEMELRCERPHRKDIRSYSTSLCLTAEDQSLEELQNQLTRTMLSGVSQLFIEFLSKQFKQYLVYCSGMGEVHNRLKQLTRDNPLFDYFLRQQIQNPACRMMDLHSFLIMPMQRITRYPMLIKELQKCTRPMSVEHASLAHVIEKCEEIISMINQRAQIVEDLEKLVRVSSSLFIPAPGDKPFYAEVAKSSKGALPFENFDIINRGRKLLMEGDFHILPSPGLDVSGDHAFLFNDIFILSRKFTERPPFSYILCRIIDRRSIIIRENNTQADGPVDPNAPKHTVQFAEIGCQMFVVSFRNKLVRNKWLSHFQKPVSLLDTQPSSDSFTASSRPSPRRFKSFNDGKSGSHLIKSMASVTPEKHEKRESPVGSHVVESSRKDSPPPKKNRRKSKDKGSSSLFSFWKSKVAQDKTSTTTHSKKVTTSPQDRIQELEQDLELSRKQCHALQQQVEELNARLLESQNLVHVLQKAEESRRKTS